MCFFSISRQSFDETSELAGQNIGVGWPNTIGVRPGYGVHYAFDVIGGIDSTKITIGIDWHRVISPYGVDRYNYPSPLFVTQLKEFAEEFNVQYWVVSFTGYSGSYQAKEDISTFVAACVSIHHLPFCGFRITKTPIGVQGKAAGSTSVFGFLPADIIFLVTANTLLVSEHGLGFLSCSNAEQDLKRGLVKCGSIRWPYGC